MNADSILPSKTFLHQAAIEFAQKYPKWVAVRSNQTRLELATDSATSGFVVRTANPHKFLVCSNSTMGQVWGVDRQARSCDCPDYRSQSRLSPVPVCKHRLAVHLALRAQALEFEYKEWSKAFDAWTTSQGTDDETETYARLAGWDVVSALQADSDNETHQDALRQHPELWGLRGVKIA